MKIHGITGGPEDLIRKLDFCPYCIFEDIIPEEQRKIKVLDLPIPKNHAHRPSLEYACGESYDEVCPMKYIAMRAFPDDETACQLGTIKDFIWDLGKKQNKKIDYWNAIPLWTRKQDLGREFEESYAQRFRAIWRLGLRKLSKEKPREFKQILTSPQIYEMVVASPKVYEQSINNLEALKKESSERDKTGI